MPLPQHIAIIPDGNRRWAKKNGLPAFFGHREGAKTTEKILKTALELKIPYFTLWGCSIGNITKRDKKEVDFLFKLFETNFKKLTKDKEIHKNEMKINVLGAWRQYFPESTRRIIEEMMEKTKNYRRYQLTFLLAYSGLEEMARAVGEILANPPLPVESPPDGESGSRLPRLAAGLAIGTSGDYIRVIHV